MTTTEPGAPPPRPAPGVRVVAVVGPDAASTSAVVAGLVGLTGAAAAPEPRPGLTAVALETELGPLRLLHATGAPASEAAVVAALRGSDAVLLVLPAVGGPDPRTVQLWGRCAARGLPRAVAVTGLGAPHADFDEAVALCQRMLGDDVMPLQLPMHGDDDEVAGALDLLRLRVEDWSSGAGRDRTPDPEHVRMVEGLRGDLVEAVLAGSEDDALLDAYLDGELLGPDVLARELAAAVGAGRLHPVLAVQHPVGSGGLQALLAALPAAQDVEPPAATRPDGSPVAPLAADPDGPLAAEVLAADGGSWLVRVRSGTLLPGTPVRLAAQGRAERDVQVGGLSGPHLAGCAAGDLCTVSGLDAAATGDTVSAPDDPLLLEAWDLPEPLHPVTLAPADLAGLDAALERLGRTDPTLRVDTAVQPPVLWTLDGAHAEAVVDRLRGEGLAVEHAAADLGSGPDLALVLECPTGVARPVLRALARHGALDVVATEDDEHDVTHLALRLPPASVPGLAAALAAASGGTARGRSRSG